MIWPEAMLFLLLVPLTWLLLQRLDRVRRDRLKRYVGTRIGAAVGDSGGDRCRVLFSSALLLAVVAVMQPTWGTAVRHIDQLDVDVVVCLDVSRSMLARDVAPSRLAHTHTQSPLKVAEGLLSTILTTFCWHPYRYMYRYA